MPEPAKKKIRTEGATFPKKICYMPIPGKEDDPDNWDDVNEDSWSIEIDDSSMMVNPVPLTVSSVNQQQGKEDNPPLHQIQAKMDRLRTAINFSRFSVKPDFKLTRLFGPLEIESPITHPSIMIREGNVTTRYIRDFSGHDMLEHNNCYVFRRSSTSSSKSEYSFCIDLAITSQNSDVLTHAFSVCQATLSEGNERAFLPELFEQIKNHKNDHMVILHTRKKSKKSELYVSIFFERRALFLESIASQFFDMTPLSKQPATIKLLQLVDLYNIRKWRQWERTSPRVETSIQTVKDATTIKWEKWKLTMEGCRVKRFFEDYVNTTPLFKKPIANALFDYICEYICNLFRLQGFEAIWSTRRQSWMGAAFPY
jgi:hypothetical protein